MRLPPLKTLSKSLLDLMVFTGCLDSEPLATLGTTAGENVTAALGGHAGTEAVALGALPLVGLIRTLHGEILLSGTEPLLKQSSSQIVGART